MSISTKFGNFCSAIKIPTNITENISYRYKRITKQLNRDFRDIESDTSYSWYVGSYGRDTDIHVSDIDVLFQLPYEVYERISKRIGNIQSCLLQEVRTSLQKTYIATHISGDGQVVKINFEDGVNFEIVVGFVNDNGNFIYPDTNAGGSWKKTNPKPEIEAIKNKNNQTNGNLKNLCRITRAWKDKWDVPMGGLLIDTLSYNFLTNWQHRDKSFIYYDWMVRDFFEFLKTQNQDKSYWLAPGSNQQVLRNGIFEHKALRCYNIALEAIDYETREMPHSANVKWKEIFGSKFTG